MRQANKLLTLGRRRSNATAVELDTARRKFWDAVDGYTDDLMLVGADQGKSDVLRLRAERDAARAENERLNVIKYEQQKEIAALRRNQSAQSSDEEFEQLLRENGQLIQERDRLREELSYRDRARDSNPIPPVPPVPPVQRRR